MQSILRLSAFADEVGKQYPVHRLLLMLALWHHRHRSRRHLAALDDRELDDIGLSRAKCHAECRKRFWQA